MQRRALLILFVFVCSGCAQTADMYSTQTVKMYSGPDKPRSELVTLESGNSEYHYLPGRVVFRSTRGQRALLSFNGKAGRKYVYRLYWVSLDRIQERWGIFDETTQDWVATEH